MAWNPEPAITVVPPAAGEARQILRAYLDDVATRYYGRQATEEEICLEDHARQNQVRLLRLDTRSYLLEARQLCARHGYREAVPFSRGPYADHWYEKALP
jgi:hypothetical protein